MATSGIQSLRAYQAMNIVVVFMILFPTSSVCTSVDENIMKSSKELNTFNFFHVTNNYTIDVKVELDMMMTIDQYKTIYGSADSARGKRKAIADPGLRWAHGIVFYELADNIAFARDEIQKAIRHWHTYTCMVFYETKLTIYGIKFQSGTSCYSYIGNIWRAQDLVLAADCINQQNINHEIGHAVGFIHEHSRPDRDSYIRLNLEGLSQNILKNFNKNSESINNYGISYDYTSIMHYSGLGVITTLDPAYQNIIGTSDALSFKDIKLANLMYDCATMRSNCPQKSCPFNGFVFFRAFKGKPRCECFCDSGNLSDPLVACSTITQEVPGYNILAVGAIESTAANQCFDLRNNCLELKSQGLCLTELRKMATQCAKTCNYCNKPQHICMDYGVGCKLMAASCTDPDMEETMQNECPKTCKVCSNPATACDIQHSYNKEISNAVSIKANLMNMFALMHIFSIFHGYSNK